MSASVADGGELNQRVGTLESQVGQLLAGFNDLKGAVDGITGQMSKLVDSLGEKTATVKEEMREEQERSARSKSGLLKDALALGGFVALVVGAFGGPYLNKINATAEGQSEDTKSISAVREVLAQQGAGIGRNTAAIDLIREANRARDDRAREIADKQAWEAGWMAAKFGYPGGR